MCESQAEEEVGVDIFPATIAQNDMVGGHLKLQTQGTGMRSSIIDGLLQRLHWKLPNNRPTVFSILEERRTQLVACNVTGSRRVDCQTSH